MTPPNTWLVCGRSIAQGCTCTANDPTSRRVTEALTRLAQEPREEAEPVTAPRPPRRGVRKAQT